MNETRYQIEAFNTAFESENRIHDDGIAQKFGFEGGLVPGVDDYAYMTRAAVIVFGPEFLSRGHISCRFDKPVYDGETIDIVGTPGAGDALDIRIEARGMTVCTATAHMPAGAAPSAPPAAEFATRPMPSHDGRPKADETTLAQGTVLGTISETVDAPSHAQYLGDVREVHPLYAESSLVHPGFLLRRANTILRDTVRLGPWIHVGSAIQFHSTMAVGQSLETRGRVADLFDRKGHGFVDLDILMLADGDRAVASVRHTAIYEPRQIRAA